MKIYLAGKIYGSEWRDRVLTAPVYQLDHRSNIYSHGDEWPVIPKAVLGIYDYVGPFYAGHHNEFLHTDHPNSEVFGDDTNPEQLQIINNCLAAIKKADLVFANIFSRDVSIGGCIEIGWSYQLGKPIAGYGDVSSETWFVRRMCDYWFDSARGSIDQALRVALDVVNYREYINSPEWKAFAAQIKAKRGNRCQICNAEGLLDAHHRTYAWLGWEAEDDITVLCRACHDLYETHKRLPKPPEQATTSGIDPLLDANQASQAAKRNKNTKNG